jgi:hypothetical protein
VLDRDPVAHLAVGIVVELRRAADLDVAQRLCRIEHGQREPRIASQIAVLLPARERAHVHEHPVKPILDRRALELPSGRTVLSTAVFGAPRRS